MPPTIDDALEVLQDRGPEFGPGLSNHGPMAAEALLALGRADAVLPYAEKYRRRLSDRPSPVAAIDPRAWQDALGDVRRVSDWSAFFEAAIEEEGWPATVRMWVPRLVPGVMAGATHGLIRTAHAARSLRAAETPARLHELAEGLGYWAARYQPLPGSPSGRDACLDPAEAVHRLPRFAGEDRGLIFESVRGLDQQPSFASAIDLVDTSGDLSLFVSRLTATSAAVFLANPQSSFQFIHAVTAPSALRMLVPYLADKDARLAVRYAWQAVAGLYAWFATAHPCRWIWSRTRCWTPPTSWIEPYAPWMSMRSNSPKRACARNAWSQTPPTAEPRLVGWYAWSGVAAHSSCVETMRIHGLLSAGGLSHRDRFCGSIV